MSSPHNPPAVVLLSLDRLDRFEDAVGCMLPNHLAIRGTINQWFLIQPSYWSLQLPSVHQSVGQDCLECSRRICLTKKAIRFRKLQVTRWSLLTASPVANGSNGSCILRRGRKRCRTVHAFFMTMLDNAHKWKHSGAPLFRRKVHIECFPGTLF